MDRISDLTATHPSTVRRIYRKFSPDYLEEVALLLDTEEGFANQFAKRRTGKRKRLAESVAN